ncbi:unnamed protein product [Mytilus coruscus]|uniref:Uncharacterized protein n=1 Tax=Mytilus coruscus TaxID=42192 RepID=A0A6J8B9I2_MYTCO|nr:unnamed protein product [Mytilus coruscus]
MSIAEHEIENREGIPDKEHCAYSLVFDNVNKHFHAKQTTRDKGNVMKNMVQAYAALDRVPSLDLDNHQLSSTKFEESHAPISYQMKMKSDYIQLVRETLIEHIPFFKCIQLERNIEHVYEDQSAERSNLIPLGVLDKDETKIADMVDIMENYHKYVLGSREEDPITIPLFVEGLSVERSYDAQNARINADNAW